jgi:hypothetical protein
MSNEKRVRRADLAWSADARPVRMGGGAGGVHLGPLSGV